MLIKLVLSEIVEAVDGVAENPPPFSIERIATDTRELKPESLFFALRGLHFDAHQFVDQAFAAGALAAVVSNDYDGVAPAGRTLIRVDDPRLALGRLAAFHRRQLSASVIAVVGSNGKTTTKSMIDHILSGSLQGRCSPRSYNNDVGVPLTLLSATTADDYLVVEIGSNSPGEVAALAELVQPDKAVITNIGEEHLAGFGSLSGVAAEECSILKHIEPGGFACVNVDHELIAEQIAEATVTIVGFGASEAADLRVTDVRGEGRRTHFTINGRFEYMLPIPGPHNAINAAAAIGIARRFGLDDAAIAERLTTFALPPMRGEYLKVGAISLLNDAYNANPPSALAAVETLESLPCDGRRFVVFGEMRELGEHAAAQHARVAERIRASSVARVALVGRAAEWMTPTLHSVDEAATLFGPQVSTFDDVSACCEWLLRELEPGDLVLLKGSRAVGLERIVAALRERFAQTSAA